MSYTDDVTLTTKQDEKSSLQSNSDDINADISKEQILKLDLVDLQQTALNLLEDNTKCREENKNTHNRFLEALADSQNMKKRYEKQLQDVKKHCLTDIGKEIVSILDNVTLAIEDKYVDQESFNRVHNVLKLTNKQVNQFLEKFKICSVSANIGDSFNYDLHHAISKEYDSKKASDTIVKVVQQGYFMEDRLLRPALVIVSTQEKLDK